MARTCVGWWYRQALWQSGCRKNWKIQRKRIGDKCANVVFIHSEANLPTGIGYVKGNTIFMVVLERKRSRVRWEESQQIEIVLNETGNATLIFYSSSVYFHCSRFSYVDIKLVGHQQCCSKYIRGKSIEQMVNDIKKY